MRLGWLDFWSPRSEHIQIMAGFGGVDEAEVTALSERPFWVSSLDLA